jgi:hypothetical protein
MDRVRKRVAAAVAVAASGTQPERPGGTGRAPDGRFHPNEDKAHEAGESKAREAQEAAGKVPTVR